MTPKQRELLLLLAQHLEEGDYEAMNRTAVLDAALLRAVVAEPADPVAWCALTPSGKIAYFDGKPMVMTGPIGNDMHVTPLYPPPRHD